VSVCVCVSFDFVSRLLGVFAFYAVLFAYFFFVSHFMCILLAHYLVYLSLLMTFKWHLLLGTVGLRLKQGNEWGEWGARSEMNANRKVKHTHKYIYISQLVLGSKL